MNRNDRRKVRVQLMISGITFLGATAIFLATGIFFWFLLGIASATLGLAYSLFFANEIEKAVRRGQLQEVEDEGERREERGERTLTDKENERDEE